LSLAFNADVLWISPSVSKLETIGGKSENSWRRVVDYSFEDPPLCRCDNAGLGQVVLCRLIIS